MARRPALAAVAVALVAALAGCGSDGEEPPPRPVEKADKPAKLPAGWATEVNEAAGFSTGVPPLWQIKQGGAVSSQLLSPDKQVAIRISADRTDEALALSPERVAAETAASLPGFKGLELTGRTRPYPDRYEGAAVRARGTVAATGVPELLTVIVLKRDNLSVFPILVERRARRRSVFAKQIDPIVHSLRGRPVSVP